MRDMRAVEPGTVQMRARQALDARPRLRLNGTKFREIHRRDLGDAHPASHHWRGAWRRGGTAQEGLNVLGGDPALLPRTLQLRQGDLELASQAPDGGARMHSCEVSRRCGARCGRAWLGRWRCSLLRLRRRLLLRDDRWWGRDRRIASSLFGPQSQDWYSLTHPIADFDQDLLDRASLGGGHVHGRLV